MRPQKPQPGELEKDGEPEKIIKMRSLLWGLAFLGIVLLGVDSVFQYYWGENKLDKFVAVIKSLDNLLPNIVAGIITGMIILGFWDPIEKLLQKEKEKQLIVNIRDAVTSDTEFISNIANKVNDRIIGLTQLAISQGGMLKSSPAYAFLSHLFKDAPTSISSQLIKDEIAKMVCKKDIRLAKTDYIAEAFSGRGLEHAGEFICVINANGESSFLKERDFEKHFLYFSKFNCISNTRDVITRLFSVPAIDFKKDTGLEDKQLGKLQKKLLFKYMWINHALGVDTELHIFDPMSRDHSRAFFSYADYVVHKSPTADELEEAYKVYLALPTKEDESWEFKGSPLLCELLRIDFYMRRSPAPTDPSEGCLQFDHNQVGYLLQALNIEPSDAKNYLVEIENKMLEWMKSAKTYSKYRHINREYFENVAQAKSIWDQRLEQLEKGPARDGTQK